MAKHNKFGKDGEQKVVDYLLSQVYQILERNWAASHSTYVHGKPLDTVDERKVRVPVSAADSYVNNKLTDTAIRFDIVGVGYNEIIHIRNAFIPPAKYRG